MTTSLTEISTPNAPAAIGPYSQGVQFNGLIFISGQLGLDPQAGTLVGPDVLNQTQQILLNLAAIAESAKTPLSRLLKLTIYLVDLGDFDAVNQLLQQSLKQPYPARTTIGVNALPKGARIEIDAILAKADG
ncbi:MAG: Rid family detoxifying hydrolase [Pseudomonadales bacterium]|nr:Rid family detoxifying hydrolase [Pseudomonadales bacterium]